MIYICEYKTFVNRPNKELKDDIRSTYRYKCCYCVKDLPPSSKDLTREHLVPKSHQGNNSWYNLVSCCRLCNFWRGNKHLYIFKEVVEKYKEEGWVRPGFELSQYDTIVENITKWEKYVFLNYTLLIV